MLHSKNFYACIFIILAMGCFTLGDTITKYMLAGMNTGQYMLLRGCFASAMIAFLAWYHGVLRRYPLDRMTALRIVGDICATLTYIYSLGQLPQPFCAAIFQSAPLLETLAAALILREKVDWQRWTCVFIGFVGVLIIIRPGTAGAAEFTAVAILLASVLLVTLRDIATRRIPKNVPTHYLSLLTAVSITVAGAFLVAPMGGWQTTAPLSIAVIAGAAALLLLGYNFLIRGLREGEISLISPFRYSSLLWAIGLSMAVFGNAPDIFTIAGSVLVIGSGIYVIYREAVLKKRNGATLNPASIGTK